MKISNLQFEQIYIERKKELHAVVASPIGDVGLLIALVVVWSWLNRCIEALIGRAEIRIRKAPGVSVSREEESQHLRSFNQPESYFRF
jgi:hypothetical protein